MELETQGRAAEEIEAKLNEKKTANSITGMSGFYTNYLAKAVDPT